MRENPTEVAAGGLVLAFALGFLVYVTQTTGWGAGVRGYELTGSFNSIQGIDIGTDVRMAGVKVGNVSDMVLNQETFRADLTVQVEDGILVPEDSLLAVASEGLLGGNFIEIVPGGSFDYLAPGGTFSDTQGSVSLITLLLRYIGGGGGE